MTNANKGSPENYSTNLMHKIRNEALKSHKFLKVSETFFYDFPAPQLDQYPISLISEKIKDLVFKINPKIVFIPHIGDSHIDHQIIHKASLVALRPIYKRKNIDILAYETLSETEWGTNLTEDLFIPNYYNVLSEKDIKNKVNSFKIYKTQVKKYPHPRSIKNIHALSTFRGGFIGLHYAEAFFVNKIIS